MSHVVSPIYLTIAPGRACWSGFDFNSGYGGNSQNFSHCQRRSECRCLFSNERAMHKVFAVDKDVADGICITCAEHMPMKKPDHRMNKPVSILRLPRNVRAQTRRRNILHIHQFRPFGRPERYDRGAFPGVSERFALGVIPHPGPPRPSACQPDTDHHGIPGCPMVSQIECWFASCIREALRVGFDRGEAIAGPFQARRTR